MAGKGLSPCAGLVTLRRLLCRQIDKEKQRRPAGAKKKGTDQWHNQSTSAATTRCFAHS